MILSDCVMRKISLFIVSTYRSHSRIAGKTYKFLSPRQLQLAPLQVSVRSFSLSTDVPSHSPAALHPEHEGVVARKILFKQVKRFIERGDTAAAEQVLQATDLKTIEDPIRIFNRILIAYADSNQQVELERVFRSLLDNPGWPFPDEVSYNVYLKAVPLDRAMVVLTQMMEQGIAKTASFNTLISAYCNQGRPNEATQVLEKLMKSSEDHPDVKPDKMSFSPIIRILGKRGMPQQAEMLFDSMRARGIVPDMIAWSSVIHAWSDSKRTEALERVALLLQNMEMDVVPDTAVYNSVMLALANAGNRGPDAEGLLSRMTVEPNVITYSTCLLAWKNSPDLPEAVERGEALLQDMQSRGLKPNVVVLSTLISLYAREGMAERAEEVLEQIEKPNILTYTAVLNAWAKSGRDVALSRAFELLDRMEAQPNVTTFNTIIKVIEKCPGVENKTEALNEVGALMRRLGCMANLRTYNAIFNVCAADASGEAALHFALDSFFELRSNQELKLQIDNYTYPSLFKTLANHGASFSIVAQVFQLCCEDHAVTRMVLSHMNRCCSVEELQRLLPVRNVKDFDLKDLPRNWIRRYGQVHENTRRKR